MGSMATVVAQAVMILIVLMLSLSVHECAHAWAAKRLGDDTAERAGRLTLNPLAHADPIGTFALPLMMLIVGGGLGATHMPLFGWAKPTPVNAGRFTRRVTARRGSMWVALAGPVSNLIVALLSGLAIVALWRAPLAYTDAEPLIDMCLRMVFMNTGLAIFNALPFSPLDGEAIVLGLLPFAAAQRYASFSSQYGRYTLWAIVLFGRELLGTPIAAVARGILRVVQLAA